MMLQNMKTFKWWYIKGVSSYKDLLEKAATTEQVELTAMTEEETIVHKTVTLKKDENNLVIVEDIYLLTPNQQITDTGTVRLKKFWLVQNRCCWKTGAIDGIFTTITNGKAAILPTSVELFGIPTERFTSFASVPIKALIPIGEETYLAWEDKNRCYIVSSRETDDITIKTALQRMARLAT